MGKAVEPKTVVFYEDPAGREPFIEWLEGLRDRKGRERIMTRIARLTQGNYGDREPVGKGVSELRMFFGPGYRVYIGEAGNQIVVLLCGGDKRTQTQDIETAKAYWKEHQSHG